jgi:hypothetical protein
MGTLALVYLDATNHVVCSVLVQSGFSTPPSVEDLVGTGPRIRDPGTDLLAVNVATAALGLKVLTFDTSAFATDRATLEGLLADPLGYGLQPKDPADTKSPLVAVPAQDSAGTAGLNVSSSGGSGTLAHDNSNTVALPNASAKALQLQVVVQRGAIDASPISSPANTIGPTQAARPLQVALQSQDRVWILVETYRPRLQTVP